jgi:hypothetical protein
MLEKLCLAELLHSPLRRVEKLRQMVTVIFNPLIDLFAPSLIPQRLQGHVLWLGDPEKEYEKNE